MPVVSVLYPAPLLMRGFGSAGRLGVVSSTLADARVSAVSGTLADARVSAVCGTLADARVSAVCGTLADAGVSAMVFCHALKDAS